MSLENAMKIAASGMSAQAIRLNVTASNLANANTIAGSKEKAYRAREPVFSAILDQETGVGGVKVTSVVENKTPVQSRYEPGNSLADEQGNIYIPNVNTADEMANVMSASTEYKTNVDVMNVSKNLMMKTINMLDN